MSELCRNVLRAFMQNPPAIDAALGGAPGQLRSQETDEMIRQLKVSIVLLNLAACRKD